MMEMMLKRALSCVRFGAMFAFGLAALVGISLLKPFERAQADVPAPPAGGDSGSGSGGEQNDIQAFAGFASYDESGPAADESSSNSIGSDGGGGDGGGGGSSTCCGSC